MVLLENIDFKNLTLNSFKSFKCLCELCDCGWDLLKYDIFYYMRSKILFNERCFERSKQKHHLDCTSKTVAKLRSASSTIKCPLSHYKESFRFDPHARPASTYQPPPDLFLYVPKGILCSASKSLTRTNQSIYRYNWFKHNSKNWIQTIWKIWKS